MPDLTLQPDHDYRLRHFDKLECWYLDERLPGGDDYWSQVAVGDAQTILSELERRMRERWERSL